MKRLGATVVLVGDAYDETQAYAKQRSIDEGRVFIPPFDHPEVIAGQGTVGMEIVRQHQGPLHAVFVPIGGGGLIAGIAAYMKQVRPEVGELGPSCEHFLDFGAQLADGTNGSNTQWKDILFVGSL